jgi:hypothetical protein
VILGHEEYAGQRTHIYGIIEPYWKSLWGGNAQHNEAVNGKEERRISVTWLDACADYGYRSFFSNADNWKCVA